MVLLAQGPWPFTNENVLESKINSQSYKNKQNYPRDYFNRLSVFENPCPAFVLGVHYFKETRSQSLMGPQVAEAPLFFAAWIQ
uniref:Uncharacterized protein n=1 Tax=Anopheles darlingi TaxID=43151 RepID=A0A2M4CIQ9_ANODA